MRLLPHVGLYYPSIEHEDHEPILTHLIRRVTDCDLVASYCKTRGIAVQAGGHLGLWPRQLAKQFALVYTFEPQPSMFACLERNIAYSQNIIAAQEALGASPGKVAFESRAGGRSHVTDPTAATEFVTQTTIDSLKLPRCDLIYLDVERYEIPALEGAMETIAKYRPVIALEVLKDQEEAIAQWVKTARYTREAKTHNDQIFLPV